MLCSRYYAARVSPALLLRRGRKRTTPILGPLPILGAVPIHPSDFTICQFLVVCNITPNSEEYDEILQVITKHQVIHWTAFKDLPLRNFIDLGFKWGPAWLLLKGLRKACAIIEDLKNNNNWRD
ncbi:hypothetical protein PtB15_1B932 [Puccinia triticina]|nr:hypothetical protein PtB15_1B932 [Puccinia triticina]